ACRQQQGLDSARTERCSKRSAEFAVAIMQHKPNRTEDAVDLVNGIARHLYHPLLGRMSGDSRQGDASRLQMKKEQDVVSRQSTPREHLDGKEINACQNSHMRSNEVGPVGVLASLRSRSDTEA